MKKPTQAHETSPKKESRLPRLIHRRVFAETLGVSLRTVERWSMTGQGPKYIRVNGKLMYRESDILEWLDANTARSTTEEQQRRARGGDNAAA